MTETLVNKNQAGEGIWTSDNLVAGTNISITQIQKPVIDSNTLVLCHFNDSKTDEISGSTISTPTYTTIYVDGKFANGITGSNKYALIRFREYSTRLTGNYTIDFWVYLTAYMDYMSFFDPSGTTYRFKLSENSFSLGSNITGTGTAITDATYPSGVSFGLNIWHHLAYVNDNNNNRVYFFLDGKAIHNAIRTQTDNGIYQVAYGSTINQGLRIDELRVSNVARWTEDFTPYTEPYGPAVGPAQYQINNTQDISGLIPLTQKAAADGVASLDSNALILTAQLPTIDGGNANA